MSGFRVLSTVLFAALAVCVPSVTVASASLPLPIWLFENKPTTTALAGLVDGLVLFSVFKITGLLGGGNITIHCTGQFHGTFGPGMIDKVTDVLGLKGELNKEITCEVVGSTNSLCKAAELVLLEMVHQPWKSELVNPSGLETGAVYDLISEESNGLPGFVTTCHGVAIKCEGNDRAEFKGNSGAGNALFEFKGELKWKCSGAEEGTVTSNVIEALGLFSVS